MRKDLERLGHGIEETADRLLNHRRELARKEFASLISQVANLDIYHLPRNMVLELNGVGLKNERYIQGRWLPKHTHTLDGETEARQIIHYIPKFDFPDQSFYLLLLPEINPDRSYRLSVGLAKHDGNQYFTGWVDSRDDLIVKRFKGLPDHVALVQFNWVADLDIDELLEADKTYGAGYLYSPTEKVKEGYHPWPLPALA